MESRRKNDFSQGSIPKNILSLAIPLTVAQLTVVLYNVVDRAFIGHIDAIGRDAFTGIGLVMPVTYILNCWLAILMMCWMWYCHMWRNRLTVMKIYGRNSRLIRIFLHWNQKNRG